MLHQDEHQARCYAWPTLLNVLQRLDNRISSCCSPSRPTQSCDRDSQGYCPRNKVIDVNSCRSDFTFTIKAPCGLDFPQDRNVSRERFTLSTKQNSSKSVGSPSCSIESSHERTQAPRIMSVIKIWNALKQNIILLEPDRISPHCVWIEELDRSIFQLFEASREAFLATSDRLQ